MKLRIISGLLKNRRIEIPVKTPNFRPTMERVRESAAESLGNRLRNAVVADVCAGSGAVGFEFISRGAKRSVFVEKDRNLLKYLGKNIESLGLEKQCGIAGCTAERFADNSTEKYDVIFFDPPYSVQSADDVIYSLINLLSERGVLLYQHEREKKQPRYTFNGECSEIETRFYGKTAVEYIFK